MSYSKLFFLLPALVLSCLLSVTVVLAQSESKPANDYRIGPGDVLSVEVAGEPELKQKVKVAEQGTVRLLYIEHDLKIAGLTEHEVANLLRKELIVILKEPHVTVFIEEYHSKMASIAGAVNQPKQIALTREFRLYDLISLAGGLNEKAGSVIQLIRSRPSESLETIPLADLVRKPELNRVLQDGDFVNVPEAGVVYVSGNVNKPSAFPLKDTLRLSQAVAMAGGVAPDSKKKEVVLQRAEGSDQTKTTQIVVNLYDIEKDPSKDILLKPYDVILIPENTRAKQTRTLLQSFAGGIASALGWGILR